MMFTAATMPALPRAACKSIEDPEAFFSFDDRKTDQARNICRRCPEIRSCLAWALTHTEDGVWAATTRPERDELIARHARNAS